MALLLGLLFTTRPLRAMDANKEYLASVEQYGDIEGNYAQFEESTFEDLKKRKKLPANMVWGEVINNPAKYDMAVDTYWNDLTNTFGIPDDAYTKAMWWLMPGRYGKTGGDIEKIESDKLKNIMRNRKKNLDAHINK